MLQHSDAIVDNGFLKPLSPLILSQNELVHITVESDKKHSWDPDLSDDELVMPDIGQHQDVSVTLEVMRKIFDKIPPGEIEADLRKEREGRF